MNTRTFSNGAAAFWVFVLLFCCYAYVHQPLAGGANQYSRLDLLHALRTQHTIRIDAYYSNTVDRAYYGGHYYSEKAPFVTLLAAPAFFTAAFLFDHIGIALDSEVGWMKSDWFSTVLSAGIVTAAAGAVMLLLLLRKKCSRRAALTTVLALFLGAAPFPYATALFSHSVALSFVVFSLYFLEASAHRHRDLLAGLFAGCAFASEFTAGVACAGLFFLACMQGRGFACRFAVAALPPLLTVPLYNVLAFGSPLRMGYSFSTFKAAHAQGFFGITVPPQPSKLFYFLISPERGLFFWTPFLLLVIPGFGSIRALLPRTRAWVYAGVPVLHTLLIAGFVSWGGWALGPRYLATVLPFLALPAAYGAEHYPRCATALAFLSVLLTGGGTLINILVPLGVGEPITRFYIPELFAGRMALNGGLLLGIPHPWSVLPIIPVTWFLLHALWTRWVRG